MTTVEQFNTMIHSRVNEHMVYYIATTAFKSEQVLYEFMTLCRTPMYICGSFALTLCSPQRKYDSFHDIDIFIHCITKHTIETVIGKFIYLMYDAHNYTCTITIQNRTNKENYDFTKNELIIYQFDIQTQHTKYSVDLIFMINPTHDPIDSIMDDFDFTILHNCIYPTPDHQSVYDETTRRMTVSFSATCRFPMDILNGVLKYSPSYRKMIDSHTTSHNFAYRKKTLVSRVEKYIQRGYRIEIQKPIYEHKHLPCCVCDFDYTYLRIDSFQCERHDICVDCFHKLTTKKCPLCRAPVIHTPYTVSGILDSIYNDHSSYFVFI